MIDETCQPGSCPAMKRAPTVVLLLGAHDMRRPGWIVLGVLTGVVVGYLAPLLYWMIFGREDNPQIGLVSVFYGVPAGAVIGAIAGGLLSALSGPSGEG